MKIDLNAPLVARREIFIDAPIDAVWAVLTDITGWPDWQPDVRDARLEGGLRPGAVVRWTVDGVRVASTLEAVEPPRLVGWVSKSAGMRAVHVFMLEAHNQRTRVVTEESRSGWSARLLKLSTPHLIEPLLETTLEQLKNHAERTR